jgi:hypothetical protein
LSLADLIDVFEMEPPPLPQGQNLEDFLLSPAQPDVIVEHLRRRSVSESVRSLLRDRYACFHSKAGGIEIQLTDLSPGGRARSLVLFEEKMMILMTKGFKEVSRTGQVESAEWECALCLEIVPRDRTRCASCGSSTLQSGTIPESVTYSRLEPSAGRTNEEFMERLWELLNTASI